MESDIFKSGQLMLPQQPVENFIRTLEWGDILTNKILVVFSVCLWLVFMVDAIKFLPEALYCLKRARGSINLEHSLSLASTRNLLSLTCIIPFCLVIDYLGILNRDYIPEIWSAFAILGLLLTYVLVRFFAYTLCYPRKHASAETAIAAHRVIFTIFFLLTIVLLITMGITHVFDLRIDVIRKVSIWEIAVFYAIAFLRAGQILAGDCSGFSTILYLCGLEIVPTGLLVASVLFF